MNGKTIDLNCDMGESFGAYRLGQDEAMLNLVTSANIACGFHAGDPVMMQQTVQMAIGKGVAIGAHPGLPDLVGFGRRNMAVSPAEVYSLIIYQVGALAAFAHAAGGQLHHVKPHGALYNQAAADALLADAIATAVYQVNPNLILYGLAHSELIKAGRRQGLKTAQEVFADRTYQADGSLTPRALPNALITEPVVAGQQAVRLAQEGKVKTTTHQDLSLKADTICLHGDGPQALNIARQVKAGLLLAGITLQPCKKANEI